MKGEVAKSRTFSVLIVVTEWAEVCLWKQTVAKEGLSQPSVNGRTEAMKEFSLCFLCLLCLRGVERTTALVDIICKVQQVLSDKLRPALFLVVKY